MAEPHFEPSLQETTEPMNPIPEGLDSIAKLLQSMKSSIRDLAHRVDVLEHMQNDQKAKDPTVDTTMVDQPRPKPTGNDFLHQHVEFRRKVYREEKDEFEWISEKEEDEKGLDSAKRQFRYDTDENGKFTFTVFRYAKLYDKLRDIFIPEYDGQVTLSADRLVFHDVFALLNCRDDLLKYQRRLKETGPDRESHKEKLAEIDVFEALFNREGHLKHARDRYNTLRDQQKIDFASLKGLFKRDQLVVFRELRQEWAVARVTLVTMNEAWDPIYETTKRLEVECKAIDFDGRHFRYHLYRKVILLFSGIRNITELSVYPLEFCKKEEKERILEASIKSGAEWWRMHQHLTDTPQQPGSVAVREYSGYCETFGRDSKDEEAVKGSQLSSRVIVDPTRFPDRGLNFIDLGYEELSKLDPNKKHDGTPEENLLVLCPERVLVYSLSDNLWYYVAMTRLQQPKWIDNAWSRLVQPASPELKTSIDRIKKLAEAHKEAKSDLSMNNFTGKGKGLTFLLHGPPGVGKTMLAECLSEEHRRPLYRINLGRLVMEDSWESKIEEIFRQAHSWGAILLVDEAEVILAERTLEKMKESAWVAVFLRKIEYYEGIIFLTTNLIHMIDPAFISRVNLGLMLPGLDEQTRSNIWYQLLKSLPKSNKPSWMNEEADIPSGWKERDLNGRQIRNVIQSACLLATPPVTGEVKKKEVESALKDVVGFMDMIKSEKKNVESNHLAQWSSGF